MYFWRHFKISFYHGKKQLLIIIPFTKISSFVHVNNVKPCLVFLITKWKERLNICIRTPRGMGWNGKDRSSHLIQWDVYQKLFSHLMWWDYPISRGVLICIVFYFFHIMVCLYIWKKSLARLTNENISEKIVIISDQCCTSSIWLISSLNRRSCNDRSNKNWFTLYCSALPRRLKVRSLFIALRSILSIIVSFF
jgi:hypothetical protein